MIKLGLIGFGHWGPNLLRNFLANKAFSVVAVADNDIERLDTSRLLAENIQVTQYAEDILQSPDIDAVAIATPASTHYALAKAAIHAGKHVLVEKPLCTHSEEARDLAHHANSANVVLMVDHTLLLTPAMKKIREVYQKGELGKVNFLDVTRINLGLFQKDVNVLWDLAPHDFSIVESLFKEELLDVEATGFSHVNAKVPDMAYVTMHFAADKIAHFHFSWMSPIKIRQMIMGGSKKMLVWDDMSRKKVKIYDSGIIYQNETSEDIIVPEYRKGAVYCPRLLNQEALANVVQHFAHVIQGKEISLMDGNKGLKVVQMLEKSEKSLEKNLSRMGALRQRTLAEESMLS